MASDEAKIDDAIDIADEVEIQMCGKCPHKDQCVPRDRETYYEDGTSPYNLEQIRKCLHTQIYVYPAKLG